MENEEGWGEGGRGEKKKVVEGSDGGNVCSEY